MRTLKLCMKSWHTMYEFNSDVSVQTYLQLLFKQANKQTDKQSFKIKKHSSSVAVMMEPCGTRPQLLYATRLVLNKQTNKQSSICLNLKKGQPQLLHMTSHVLHYAIHSYIHTERKTCFCHSHIHSLILTCLLSFILCET